MDGECFFYVSIALEDSPLHQQPVFSPHSWGIVGPPHPPHADVTSLPGYGRNSGLKLKQQQQRRGAFHCSPEPRAEAERELERPRVGERGEGGEANDSWLRNCPGKKSIPKRKRHLVFIYLFLF